MKSSMIMSLVGAIAAFIGANAAIIPQPQDVWVPTILTPTLGTVWTRGTQQNVTWDTSSAPALISNKFAVVLQDANRTVLASGFDPLKGFVTVLVPTNIPASGDYKIALFGDSGNISKNFAIV